MDFTLKYRGELRRGNRRRGAVRLKHDIRLSFHEQLARIWSTHNVLSRIDRSQLPAPVRSGHDRYDLPRPLTPVAREDAVNLNNEIRNLRP